MRFDLPEDLGIGVSFFGPDNHVREAGDRCGQPASPKEFTPFHQNREHFTEVLPLSQAKLTQSPYLPATFGTDSAMNPRVCLGLRMRAVIEKGSVP
jgi:hypothetical protein